MKYSIEFCLSKYDFHKCKYFIMMREKDLECCSVAGLLAVEAALPAPAELSSAGRHVTFLLRPHVNQHLHTSFTSQQTVTLLHFRQSI